MTKKIKVLMIMGWIGPTKERKFSGIFSERQAKSLLKLGIEVHRVYVGKGFSLFQPIKSFFCLLYKRWKIKPNIIHAQYGSMTGFLGVLTRGKTPLIISFCGSDLLGACQLNGKENIRGEIGVKLSKIAANYASNIIVKSKGLMDALPDSCRPKAKIIPSGVDLKLFHPRDHNEARRKLRLPIDKKIILFNPVDNNPNKNLKLVQESFRLVKGKQSDAMLFLIQNESPEKIPLLMAASDVLLVTSYHEGSPNIVKEALACNLPIVSVPCGDVKERLQEVHPSFIVDYSPKAIVKAINKIFKINRRSNGREKVQDLSIEKIAKKIRDFYFQTIKEKNNV